MWLISYSISLDLIKPGRAEQFNIGFITMKMSRGALACGPIAYGVALTAVITSGAWFDRKRIHNARDWPERGSSSRPAKELVASLKGQ
jgi:hypothetical protein